MPDPLSHFIVEQSGQRGHLRGQGRQQGALSPWQQVAVTKGEWLMKTHPPLTNLVLADPPVDPFSAPAGPRGSIGRSPVAPSSTSPFDKAEGQALFPGAGLRGITSPSPTIYQLISHKRSPLAISPWPEAAPWGGVVSLRQQTRSQALFCGPWLVPGGP